MKLKDIKVGKEYANSYSQNVTVLEVGLYGNVFHSGAFSTFRSEHKHYVKVRGPHGYEEVIHCRAIIHDWETQEKIDKEKAEELSHGEASVAYLWSILEQNTSLTRRSCWPPTRIELNHDEVVRVCEAFVKHGKDAGERNSRTSQN